MDKAEMLAAVSAAERVVNGRKPLREAIGLSADVTVTLARALVSLDAVAAMAADMLAARQHLLDIHTTPEAEAAAEDGAATAVARLTETLAVLGYANLQIPEKDHGNAG